MSTPRRRSAGAYKYKRICRTAAGGARSAYRGLVRDVTHPIVPRFQQNRYCSPLGTPKQCRYPADKDKDICSGGATALKGGRHSSGITVQVRVRALQQLQTRHM